MNLLGVFNLPLLILYGLGTILGAGIYVLVGKVAAVAGLLTPLSFILAAFVAWLTALSYSQLVVLFPKSAGEAVYIEQSFHRHWLSISVGLLIILTGIVSAATLANGFTGYFIRLIAIDETTAIIGIVIILTALAVWGIAESLIVAALITLIEVIGLLIVSLFLRRCTQRIASTCRSTLFTAINRTISGRSIRGFFSFLCIHRF